MQKLVAVKYLGFNPKGELCCIGQSYPYTIETRKQIKAQDFIVIADESQNEDRNAVSTVRVIQVLDDNTSTEDVDKLLTKCNYRKPRDKIFIGKADLGDYFTELDKKRKREELTAKIEEHFREAEKMAIYKKLAETDPEMKALLEELEELQ